MTYILRCCFCGSKAVKNKTFRALCAGHLEMARDLDALVEDRVADMPVDYPSSYSEVIRAD